MGLQYKIRLSFLMAVSHNPVRSNSKDLLVLCLELKTNIKILGKLRSIYVGQAWTGIVQMPFAN